MSKFSVRYWMFDVFCSRSLFPVPWSSNPSGGQVLVRNPVDIQPSPTLKRPGGLGKCSSTIGNDICLPVVSTGR